MLHELKKPSGHRRKALRRGRGNASGRGNYSTRGLKGQKSRSGYSRKAGFEGGQTPLHMRLPKSRGFKQYFKLITTRLPINVGELDTNASIKDKTTINPELLIELGYGKKGDNFKILGTGSLSKVVTIENIPTSKSAKAIIEKAGGSVNE